MKIPAFLLQLISVGVRVCWMLFCAVGQEPSVSSTLSDSRGLSIL